VLVVHPALQVSKVLNTIDPVSTGASISFTIRITNTGDVVITTLPLSDTYNTTYLHYVNATPASIDNNDDGQLDWANLAPLNGLAPQASVVVIVHFTANADTTGHGLSEAPCNTLDETCNVASVPNAIVDLDGPGPQNPVTAPPSLQGADSVKIINPTAVNLVQRNVTLTNAGALLQWASETEVDMIGFNIWRYTGSGAAQKLNSTLLSAQHAGQALGASYSFVDTGAQAGQHYTYLLEIVTSDGRLERYVLGVVDGTVNGTITNVFLPLITHR
jgi:hypothetical protein